MDLKSFLDRKHLEYDTVAFIDNDPVCIPHMFTKRADIEIAGFFAAIFAWGNRTTIINKSKDLLARMDNAPHDFCLNHSDNDLKKLLGFRHRTFNETDLFYFVEFLRHHYSAHKSLETAFFPKGKSYAVEAGLDHFYKYFFSLPDVPKRTLKHIAAPVKKATCKRLCMYLRWMMRAGSKVDFGLWKSVSAAHLMMPVDLHVARVARHFKLLTRKQTDWEAVKELTSNLKEFAPDDPVKYDFALFVLGVLEKF